MPHNKANKGGQGDDKIKLVLPKERKGWMKREQRRQGGAEQALTLLLNSSYVNMNDMSFKKRPCYDGGN